MVHVLRHTVMELDCCQGKQTVAKHLPAGSEAVCLYLPMLGCFNLLHILSSFSNLFLSENESWLEFTPCQAHHPQTFNPLSPILDSSSLSLHSWELASRHRGYYSYHHFQVEVDCPSPSLHPFASQRWLPSPSQLSWWSSALSLHHSEVATQDGCHFLTSGGQLALVDDLSSILLPALLVEALPHNTESTSA